MSNFSFYSAMEGYAWGGSEILWSETAIRLSKKGHRVAASVKDWGKSASPHLEALRVAGVDVHRRPPISPSVGIRSRLARCGIRNRTRHAWFERCENAVLVFSCPINTTNLARVLAEMPASAKYAIVLQAAFDFAWPKGRAFEEIRSAYVNASRVFFVSQHNRELLETQLATRLSNAEVICNPFSVYYHQRFEAPPGGEPLRVACVARLESGIKGHDLLFRVLAQDKWRRRKIRVSLYGSGPDEHYLRALQQHWNVDSVQFCGVTDDIAGVWRTHQLGILASRGEGLPLAVLEGMLCGRPFVVTDDTGAAEVVEDERTGFIASARSWQAVDSALERAWRNRDRLAELGKAAFYHIRRRLPADPVADFASRLEALATGSARSEPRRVGPEVEETPVLAAGAMDGEAAT
ncbi:glycosyltransferase family 4 protein [Candidatus Laterigemmans baculatus]|uniref:glycosyltransferase family 4 protein n=1 Tax=Candidatus Laterigemmans baculatus TaxID=2770505 RepID=UPI0013DCCB33|nr:glycosyltransferase family 4 protein [Candidatus Laterigemmans baculatus]